MSRRLVSFIVDVRNMPGEEEIELLEVGQVLGEGRNVFTCTIEDPDAFKTMLEGLGVKVVEMNLLDNIEPIPEEVIREHNPEFIPYLDSKRLILENK